MLSIRMLGAIDLTTDEGRQVDELLRQPKLVALLAYLSMPTPGTWHRRDALIAAFWPDADDVRARTSLRNALFRLRRHLPEGAIRTRGSDDVGVDPALVRTDAAQMLDDIAAGRFRDALDRYAGDLLPALYIPDAEEFERWLEEERSRLRTAARAAATQLTDSLESQGDIIAASEAARGAAALDPDNETAMRRHIALLDLAGDRTQAVVVFEKFRDRVQAEFGVQPSSETLALITEVRARQSAYQPPRAQFTDSIPYVASTGQSEYAAPSIREVAPVQRNPTWRWLIAGALVVAAAGVPYAILQRDGSASTIGARKLVVLPMDNNSGDRSLDYVATGFAQDVAIQLEGIGGITIHSGARSDWPAETRHDYKTISAQFGPTILLRTTLTRVGDSLEVAASVVDAATSVERPIAARRFTDHGIQRAERQLAADVAGTLFKADLPAMPAGAPPHSIDPVSYKLTLQGWHQQLDEFNFDSAQKLFAAATAIDESNARAWAGLSSALSALANMEQIPFDEGMAHSEAAAKHALALDTLQGSAWANLGIAAMFKYRSLAAGLSYVNKAASVDPSNPEVFLLKGVMYRHAWKWNEARTNFLIAKALDQLSTLYPERVGAIELCANRPEAALAIYDADLRVLRSTRALTGRARALAWLGRYDDAIATLRERARANNNTRLEQRLAAAQGETGYWSVSHEEGQRQLKALLSKPTTPSLAPLTQARFAAGDIDGGFAALDEAVKKKEHWLYRLPCFPSMDEVRKTPRFAAILKAVGPLPER